VDYTPAMRLGNEWCDEVVAAMRLRTRAERVERLTAIERKYGALREEAATTRAKLAAWFGGPEARGRAIGVALIGRTAVVIQPVQDTEDRTRQVQDHLLVALALERYRRERGGYPKELSVLSPTFLSAVPEDRFRGGPLTYRRETRGYLLYSFGKNGKDDGGRTLSNDDLLADDIAIRMPPGPGD
jgi:hypothetical protein